MLTSGGKVVPRSLEALGFNSSADVVASGLVRLGQGRPTLALAEEVAAREAESIESLDYIFFRRFNDGRSPQVAAYVIDNNDERFNDDDLADIHRQVWLNGSAPLLYVGWPTRVDILSCARGPDFWQSSQGSYHYNRADEVQLPPLIATSAAVSEALDNQYSALRLSNGTFWDDPRNSSLAHADKAAHQRLIEAVVEADQILDGENRPVMRRLLLLTVLIKYLEDRGVFPSRWFAQFHEGAGTFFEFLSQGSPSELRRLLGALEAKFNGDVFSLPEDDEDTLTAEDLQTFAILVEGKTFRQQRYLWDRHSFRHLPVEVLSHLYQRFARRGNGAIYTPPFVASLLLDFAMPYESMTGHERVLDPTCGSGVFLVGAFKRLVNYWRSRNEWHQPDVQTLKRILKQSIFGIDIQQESLHLAAFSLALAVCDALRPNVIWKELQFDKLLGTNLVEDDFFVFAERHIKQPSEYFDVVIGNPPFLSELTDAAKRLDAASIGGLPPVPDKQIAYMLAGLAFGLLKQSPDAAQSGRLCLIQPAGLLYNKNPRDFQRSLLQTHRVDYVLDFTSIRGLFDEADTKVVAVVAARTAPAPSHRIRHLTFRRTFSVKEEIGFELDHYDRHLMLQHQIAAAPHAWKINLLGGGRLHHVMARFKKMGTLQDFVARMNWEYGEGFIEANSEPRKEAAWLYGKPLLPSKALTESGINEKQITRVTAKYFRSAYSQDRYNSPLVLIRENEKLQCAFWDNGFLAYKAKLVGIHAPLAEREALKHFFEEFQKSQDALRAFCLLESTQLMVGKATAILKRDIDNLPWPEEDESWDLAPWEQTLFSDLVEYMAPYTRLGQDSALLSESVSSEGVNSAVLGRYTSCYREMLGSIYSNLRVGPSHNFDGLLCQCFYFGDEPLLDWSNGWSGLLHDLVYTRQGEVLRTTRVIRFYQNNFVLLVKPDRLRYWIPSVAIRDADETLVDLRNQGY